TRAGLPMNLQINRSTELHYAESATSDLLFPNAASASELVEFYLNHRVGRVLVHANNFSRDFFDLKTGMAGAFLEKCRQYRLRIAIVVPPEPELSNRFREFISEENKRPFAHFSATEPDAIEWLTNPTVQAAIPRRQ